MKNALLAALCLFLASCQTTTPDLSGAGFVRETPNAEMRQAMIRIDRPFAEQVAINRAACEKSPGCQK